MTNLAERTVSAGSSSRARLDQQSEEQALMTASPRGGTGPAPAGSFSPLGPQVQAVAWLAAESAMPLRRHDMSRRLGQGTTLEQCATGRGRPLRESNAPQPASLPLETRGTDWKLLVWYVRVVCRVATSRGQVSGGAHCQEPAPNRT